MVWAAVSRSSSSLILCGNSARSPTRQAVRQTRRSNRADESSIGIMAQPFDFDIDVHQRSGVKITVSFQINSNERWCTRAIKAALENKLGNPGSLSTKAGRMLYVNDQELTSDQANDLVFTEQKAPGEFLFKLWSHASS